MRLAARKAGATRTMANGHARKSGTQRTFARAWIRNSDGLKQFYASLASGGGSGAAAGITVYPEHVSGTIIRSGSSDARSGQVTVTVTGGIAPYTYNWVYESGDASIAADPTDGSVVDFVASVDPGASISAVFHCDVTDAGGTTASSDQVTVTLNNFGDPV